MQGELEYWLAAGMASFGAMAIIVAAWVDLRRAANPIRPLVSMTPFMLLGTIAVLVSIVYFLHAALGDHAGYYIAAAMMLFGATVVAVTVLIEHRRRTNARGYWSSTTPFVFLGAIVVLVGIVLFLSVLRDEPRKPRARNPGVTVVDCLMSRYTKSPIDYVAQHHRGADGKNCPLEVAAARRFGAVVRLPSFV